MTDEKILKMLEQNLEEGIRELMKKYAPIVQSICVRKLHNQEDVKECVNAVFAEFCLKYQRYDMEKGNLKSYLCTIAERRAIDKYRKNIKKEEIERRVREQYKENIVECNDQEELEERLSEAIEKLDPLDRKIIEKYYYEGYSYAEIAKELNVNYEMVKKRGVRGRKKLLYLILIGILVFAITACTTVVLKQEGLLPVWFPFYEFIPSIKKEEIKQDERKEISLGIEYESVEETGETNEEIYVEEPTASNEKKYYVSDTQGLIWSEKEVFEMKKPVQKIQKNDIIYELKSVFYQDGKWEIDFIVTCTDLEKVTVNNKSENEWSDEEKVKNNEVVNKWIDDEFKYLSQAYLLLPDAKKCFLFERGYTWIKGDVPKVVDKYHVTMETEGFLKNEKSNEVVIRIVMADGSEFEIVMEKIKSKGYIDEFPEPEEVPEDSQEQNGLEEQAGNKNDILKVGVTEIVNGQTIISLHQNKNTEYQIAARITQDYFGPIGIANETVSLINENGDCSDSVRINAKNLEDEWVYEVYFQGEKQGRYKLYIPFFCVLKDMRTETLEIPLPVGEECELLCEIPVDFPDGTGFVIRSVKRHEEIGYIYNVIDNQLVIEEVTQWMYELKYEMNEGSEMKFNTAKAIGITSENDAVNATLMSINNEMKYVLRTQSEKMAESMKVEFYEPLYLWENEMTLDVLCE